MIDLKGITEFNFVTGVEHNPHGEYNSQKHSLFQVLVKVRESHVAVRLHLERGLFMNTFILSERGLWHISNKVKVECSQRMSNTVLGASIPVHSLQLEVCLSTQDGGICE